MEKLTPKTTYANMYILLVDAAGHSNVVASNPADVSASGYDILEQAILSRFISSASSERCRYFERWGWQGDGGMFMIHDEDESASLRAAIKFAKNLLYIDLPALKREFASRKINGSLHIRVAIHKANVTYISDDNRGSIHSTEINHVAHLEKATPKDCVAITQQIYNILGAEKEDFHLVGKYEKNEIALYSPELNPFQLKRKWYSSQGLGGETLQALLQRPSEENKSFLLGTAITEVIDLGTALRTCARYLNSTQRPAIYRDTVIKLLNRGCKYKCFILDPKGVTSEILSKRHNEDLSDKITSSLKDFKSFIQKNPEPAKNLELYQYDVDAGLAAIGVDIESDEGVIVYSPMIPPVSEDSLERADIPHYLVDTSKTDLYGFHRQHIKSVMERAARLNLDEI